MPKKLIVAELGDPVLRKKSEKVKNAADKEIQTLIDRLIKFVMKVNGVGISAPQVYENKRLFILASHPNKRYPQAPLMAPMAVINPKIISHSKGEVKGWEGCLSVPGIKAMVPRWKKIEVEFTNRKGKIVKRSFSDFIAKIFQHELDHLNGYIFLDRVKNNHEIITDKECLKLFK